MRRRFTFQVRYYRWRDWPSCGDPECGCGQERGEHEHVSDLGGADEADARARLAANLDDDGCALLEAVLLNEYEYRVVTDSEIVAVFNAIFDPTA